MKRVIVLGAGMVGRAIAVDMSKKYLVTSVDLNENALEQLSGKDNIRTRVQDVTDPDALAGALEAHEMVISAVPGFLGFQTMIRVIKQKKDLVDISFMPEDALQLDSLAKENGVTVVMDCGVAPGMPNYMVGYHNQRMKIDQLDYMVGGLPRIREWPFEYKAPFSPADVIEEYTRPARYVENYNLIVKPAMSDAEYVHFERIGTLEAFNTDGLRSLLFTMKHIPYMKEKTLRYPGHIQLIRAMQSAGFFNKEDVKVNGVQISPLDFTSALLFRNWRLGPEEPEFTVMRVSLKGEGKEVIYELYDENDPVEKISSMARTTGFTATGTAEMILNNTFTEKGVFPPELVGGHPGCFEFIMKYLQERNVRYDVFENEL